MSRTVETVVPDMSYTECPRWHDGRIWFSDFYTHRVYSAAEDGSDLRVEAEVPHQPSGLGWLPDGRLLIVSMRDRRVLRRENDGTLATHADLSAHVSGHLNDMVVDDRGRAFVGEFGFDLMGGAPPATGVLVRVDPDGTTTTVAQDLCFPNGSVITGDGTLLVCETFGNRVTAFDIAGDGSVSGRRAWATFGAQPTAVELDTLLTQVVVGPDGCGLDADGALWIADAVGGRVVRVRAGGEHPHGAASQPKQGRSRARGRRDRRGVPHRQRGVRLHARRTGRAHAVRVRCTGLPRGRPRSGAGRKSAQHARRRAPRRSTLTPASASATRGAGCRAVTRLRVRGSTGVGA